MKENKTCMSINGAQTSFFMENKFCQANLHYIIEEI